jgi:hypothetical protein
MIFFIFIFIFYKIYDFYSLKYFLNEKNILKFKKVTLIYIYNIWVCKFFCVIFLGFKIDVNILKLIYFTKICHFLELK